MRDQALLIALARTARAIRENGKKWAVTVVDRLGKERVMDPDEAAELVYSAPGLFCGSGSSHRVKRMEWKQAPKPNPEWIKCYRNTDAVCLWTAGHYTPHQA